MSKRGKNRRYVLYQMNTVWINIWAQKQNRESWDLLKSKSIQSRPTSPSCNSHQSHYSEFSIYKLVNRKGTKLNFEHLPSVSGPEELVIIPWRKRSKFKKTNRYLTISTRVQVARIDIELVSFNNSVQEYDALCKCIKILIPIKGNWSTQQFF